MKICRFNQDRLGLIEGDHVFDVSAALNVLPASKWPAPYGDPLFLHLESIKAAIGAARAGAVRYDLADVKLMSLCTAPSKIMAAPANYRLHALEANDPGIGHGVHNVQLAGVDRPVDKLGVFLKSNTSIVGPSEGVALKFLDRRNDHEVELCCVIGKGGRDIPRDKAFEHIASGLI